MKFNSKWVMASAVLAFGVMLQGCSTTSSHPDSNGQSSNIVFPKVDSAWPKEGTFPNLDNLRTLAPGMTKDQLYELLGRPHFNEGVAGVREWDYLFEFRTGKGDEVETCQFKVLFDSNKLSRSYHWMPESCADYMKRPSPAPAVQPVVTPAPVALRNGALAADGLFSFGGSHLDQLNPKGRAQLTALAAELGAMKSVSRIEVKGYTDRIGSDASNQELSLKRAETVRAFLVDKGVDPRVIVAHGYGNSDPVVQCADMPRAALIKCLAPNRRIEVSAVGLIDSKGGA